MNAAESLVDVCSSIGVSLAPLNDGRLYVEPIAKLPDELRQKLVANKPEIIDYLKSKQRLHIHRVLVRLKTIQPYRDGDTLRWRDEPTSEQMQLLHNYHSQLLEALRPRALTTREAGYLALWLDDIAETDNTERNYVFEKANTSPTDRTALLWMADGSPKFVE